MCQSFHIAARVEEGDAAMSRIVPSMCCSSFHRSCTADYLQENVTAVLTRSPVDVLSHVAIRARSQGVFLATCFDEAQMSGLLEQQGQFVMLSINASGSVEATPADASAQQGSKQGGCT